MATEQEIANALEQVTDDVIAGVSSTSVDGMSVTQADAGRRLDVIERLEKRNAARTGGGLLPFGRTRVISKGL